MQNSWRVTQNSDSKVVGEEPEAFIEENVDELLSALPLINTTCRRYDWYQRWNFPHPVEVIDGKHVKCYHSQLRVHLLQLEGLLQYYLLFHG